MAPPPTPPAKMKVDQLRSELRERGLDTAGTKPILMARLLDALSAPPSDASRPVRKGVNAAADQAAASSKRPPPPAKPVSARAELSARDVGDSASAGNQPALDGKSSGGKAPVEGYEAEMKPPAKIVVTKLSKGSKPLEAMTLVERAAARAARFGGTVEGTLAMRAERFGIASVDVPPAESGKVSTKKRGKSAKEMIVAEDVTAEEAARREKRAKRFAAH
jgi:SAP domain